MAVAATTVWEVRTATGSDNNGGGYVAGGGGTDYSQQASPQYAFTDLVIAATTTNVTSISHSFVAADVGNFIQVTAGTNFTKGIYQIVSVATGIATCDRSVGTAAATGGTWNEGGALASILPIVTRAINSAIQGVNGNTIYMVGTQTTTSTIQNYDLINYSLIGYGTSRGDGGIATISTVNNINMLSAGNGGMDWQFYNIKFLCTYSGGGSNSLVYDGGNSLTTLYFEDCIFNGQWAVYNSNPMAHLIMVNCSLTGVTNSGNGGVGTFAFDNVFIGCYFYGNSGGPGCLLRGSDNGNAVQSAKFIGCVFYNNGTHGIQCTYPGKSTSSTGCTIYCWNCAFVSNTNDGLHDVASGSGYAPSVFLFNCIFVSNGGYGVAIGAPAYVSNYQYTISGRNNAFYNNGTADRSNFPILPGDFSLTASPFVSPSTNNFTLNNTAGGGALCQAAGWQSTLIG